MQFDTHGVDGVSELAGQLHVFIHSTFGLAIEPKGPLKTRPLADLEHGDSVLDPGLNDTASFVCR